MIIFVLSSLHMVRSSSINTQFYSLLKKSCSSLLYKLVKKVFVMLLSGNSCLTLDETSILLEGYY